MTTIIFDGKKLYADTQLSVVDGDRITGTFTGNKIWKINGTFCSGSGSLYVVNLMRDFVHNWSIKCLGFTFDFDMGDDLRGISSANDEFSHVIVIRKAQPKVYQLHSKIKTLRIFHKTFTLITVKAKLVQLITGEAIFMGSGQDYALDYMLKGHDAVTAIKMTAEHDRFTNNLVNEVEV
jgi:hypothetical protein